MDPNITNGVETRKHEQFNRTSVLHVSTVDIRCPFCGKVTTCYLRSLAGAGRKCVCAAKHLLNGTSIKPVEMKDKLGKKKEAKPAKAPNQPSPFLFDSNVMTPNGPGRSIHFMDIETGKPDPETGERDTVRMLIVRHTIAAMQSTEFGIKVTPKATITGLWAYLPEEVTLA